MWFSPENQSAFIREQWRVDRGLEGFHNKHHILISAMPATIAINFSSGVFGRSFSPHLLQSLRVLVSRVLDCAQDWHVPSSMRPRTLPTRLTFEVLAS
jgi:hypothetical protein